MPRSKWPNLLLLALAALLAMSLWFSATAVVPALVAQWELSGGEEAWLTMSVQIGFVTGALLSAFFNVPDLWAPRNVFAIGALSGAALNALIPALEPRFAVVLLLRFGTGMALAAVYPVGMKIMATWTREDRGLGIGLLVGALTVGSASPHLVRALGGFGAWQPVLYAVSILAVMGGLLGWRCGKLGPYRTAASRFDWRQIARAFKQRGLLLANLGYLGHMWELYAMWTWVPRFLLYTFKSGREDAGKVEGIAALAAFVVIAIGGLGSILAGRLADRWGRTRTTILSMAISGSCAACIGLFVAHPLIVTVIALVWGFSIVADSAQFSSSISELSEPEYMGTQLTTQTSMGFLLTLASIRMMPGLVDLVSWRWAFAALALGPVLGIWAMAALQRAPEASRLAGGRG